MDAINATAATDILEQHGWTIRAMRNFNLGFGSVEVTKPGRGSILVYGRTASEGLSRAVDQVLATEAQ